MTIKCTLLVLCLTVIALAQSVPFHALHPENKHDLPLSTLTNTITSNLSNAEIDKIFSDATSPEGFVIVTIANDAHSLFVRNLIQSMRNLNNNLDKHLVVIALDEIIAEKLSTHAEFTNSIHASNFYDMGDFDAPVERDYWNPLYNKLTFMKMEIMYQILKRYDGKKLVFTDSDLVWLNKNMLSYLNYYTDVVNFDFVMQREVWNDFYLPCTGFYAVKSTQFTRDFVASVIDYDGRQGFGGNDQSAFQDEIRKLDASQLLKHFYMLPFELFMNGKGHDENLQGQWEIQPMLFHANYRVGSQQKYQLLRDAGHWLLEEGY